MSGVPLSQETLHALVLLCANLEGQAGSEVIAVAGHNAKEGLLADLARAEQPAPVQARWAFDADDDEEPEEQPAPTEPQDQDPTADFMCALRRGENPTVDEYMRKYEHLIPTNDSAARLREELEGTEVLFWGAAVCSVSDEQVVRVCERIAQRKGQLAPAEPAGGAEMVHCSRCGKRLDIPHGRYAASATCGQCASTLHDAGHRYCWCGAQIPTTVHWCDKHIPLWAAKANAPLPEKSPRLEAQRTPDPSGAMRPEVQRTPDPIPEVPEKSCKLCHGALRRGETGDLCMDCRPSDATEKPCDTCAGDPNGLCSSVEMDDHCAKHGFHHWRPKVPAPLPDAGEGECPAWEDTHCLVVSDPPEGNPLKVCPYSASGRLQCNLRAQQSDHDDLAADRAKLERECVERAADGLGLVKQMDELRQRAEKAEEELRVAARLNAKWIDKAATAQIAQEAAEKRAQAAEKRAEGCFRLEHPEDREWLVRYLRAAANECRVLLGYNNPEAGVRQREMAEQIERGPEGGEGVFVTPEAYRNTQRFESAETGCMFVSARGLLGPKADEWLAPAEAGEGSSP